MLLMMVGSSLSRRMSITSLLNSRMSSRPLLPVVEGRFGAGSPGNTEAGRWGGGGVGRRGGGEADLSHQTDLGTQGHYATGVHALSDLPCFGPGTWDPAAGATLVTSRVTPGTTRGGGEAGRWGGGRPCWAELLFALGVPCQPERAATACVARPLLRGLFWPCGPLRLAS